MYGDGDTAGNVAINKIPLATNQACCNFVLDPARAHYRFVYYYLKGSYNNLVNLKLGGSQQNLNAQSLKQFPFEIPSVDEQKKIAAILSAYDDLIENNRRRIALLEKMAEEIYREWFVRMRFPGHEQAKFEKGVPTGWEVKRVAELVVRKKFGRICRETELLPTGEVVVIDQSKNEYLGFYDGKPEHVASPESPLVIFGDHSCKMQLMFEPFSLAENVIPFAGKDGIPPIFLFYLVHSLVGTTEYKRHWTDLVTKEIYLPTSELRTLFDEQVRALIVQTKRLKAVGQQLTRVRDALLPRLISGKLAVENLDIRFPPSMAEPGGDIPEAALS